ncbi:MAG: pilin protein [Selenomonadaceae bacterium]|nr:pilin protein [Selenomonadaceae bacterium]
MFKHIYAFTNKIKSYLSEKGQGMVEYALILALVAGIAAVALNGGLRDAVSGAFTKATSQINSATGS